MSAQPPTPGSIVAGVIYRYLIRLPVVMDAQRPAWPPAINDRLMAVRDVADVTFGDDVCAWSTGNGVRAESRRQRIEVITVSVDDAGAELARVALFTELETQRVAAGIPRLIIVRGRADGATLP